MNSIFLTDLSAPAEIFIIWQVFFFFLLPALLGKLVDLVGALLCDKVLTLNATDLLDERVQVNNAPRNVGIS